MTYTTIYNDPYSRAKIIYPWIYWDNAFSEEELDKIISYCEMSELDRGLAIGGDDSSEVVTDYRISDVSFHHRNPETAWIFDRLNFAIQSVNEQFFNYHLNGYDSFQYTTYDSAQNGHYDWHMDMHLGPISDSARRFDEPRKLSLTLMLNDDYEGGEFQLNCNTESAAIVPEKKKGRILMFPSFILHRVSPVTKGTRKSLVVWVTGPKFV